MGEGGEGRVRRGHRAPQATPSDSSGSNDSVRVEGVRGCWGEVRVGFPITLP